MIAAMADASFAKSAIHIERYQNAVQAKGHALLRKYDAEAAKITDPAESRRLLEKADVYKRQENFREVRTNVSRQMDEQIVKERLEETISYLSLIHI